MSVRKRKLVSAAIRYRAFAASRDTVSVVDRNSVFAVLGDLVSAAHTGFVFAGGRDLVPAEGGCRGSWEKRPRGCRGFAVIVASQSEGYYFACPRERLQTTSTGSQLFVYTSFLYLSFQEE